MEEEIRTCRPRKNIRVTGGKVALSMPVRPWAQYGEAGARLSVYVRKLAAIRCDCSMFRIRKEVSDAENQPIGHGPEGCDANGPAAALLVGYVSIKICALLTASPARTVLPAAHFDRNESYVISRTGH